MGIILEPKINQKSMSKFDRFWNASWEALCTEPCERGSKTGGLGVPVKVPPHLVGPNPPAHIPELPRSLCALGQFRATRISDRKLTNKVHFGPFKFGYLAPFSALGAPWAPLRSDLGVQRRFLDSQSLPLIPFWASKGVPWAFLGHQKSPLGPSWASKGIHLK